MGLRASRRLRGVERAALPDSRRGGVQDAAADAQVGQCVAASESGNPQSTQRPFEASSVPAPQRVFSAALEGAFTAPPPPQRVFSAALEGALTPHRVFSDGRPGGRGRGRSARPQRGVLAPHAPGATGGGTRAQPHDAHAVRRHAGEERDQRPSSERERLLVADGATRRRNSVLRHGADHRGIERGLLDELAFQLLGTLRET